MEYRKLSELKKLTNNPRTIKKDDMERLMKSIEENQDYFDARPLILSDRTGELVIIAGNQRYEASKRLKLDTVPTYIIKGLTEEREKEIIIRDNVSNGEWDWDILANEWDEAELNKWGLDVPDWSKGLDVNNMTDEDVDLEEEFDPIGTMDGKQRVVFLFDGKEEAESYLNSLKVKFKKMNMAWQVNLCTPSI